jgi:hypothetical protein
LEESRPKQSMKGTTIKMSSVIWFQHMAPNSQSFLHSCLSFSLWLTGHKTSDC